MRIDYSKRFLKQLVKSDVSIQEGFQKRLELFIENKSNPVLNVHILKGEYLGYKSMNLTENWRALYRELENGDIIFFDFFGTHSELYK